MINLLVSVLKNGFEKTPTGELPMQFNKKALKTKGAVGIENLYEVKKF